MSINIIKVMDSVIDQKNVFCCHSGFKCLYYGVHFKHIQFMVSVTPKNTTLVKKI